MNLAVVGAALLPMELVLQTDLPLAGVRTEAGFDPENEKNVDSQNQFDVDPQKQFDVDPQNQFLFRVDRQIWQYLQAQPEQQRA